MKKRIISIFVSLMLLFCIGAMTACGKGDKTEHPEDTNENLWLDFEQWGPDFQLCHIAESFGRVSVNKDLTFVKSGKQSAKIEPLAGGWVYFPLWSDIFDFDRADFTYVDYVSIEINNAQNSAMTIGVGFAGSESGISINRYGEKSVTLAPGWNTVFLTPDDFLTWLFGFDISKMGGIYLNFEKSGMNAIADKPPSYYLDDIQIIKKDTPAQTTYTDAYASEMLNQMGIKDNEIYSFETNAFMSFFTSGRYAIESVNVSDYGMLTPPPYNISLGNRMLKMTVISSGRNWGSALVISPTPIKRVTAGLTEEQIKKAYFCFDQYNKGSYVENNVVTINRYQITNNVPLNQWSTFEIKLTDILAKTGKDWTNSPGQISIQHYDASGEKTFFFDNFRIEIRD